jgi:protein-glutamine gamma-glutamyltransferase
MLKNIFQQDGYKPREVEHAFTPRSLVFLTVVVAILATAFTAQSPLFLPVTAISVTLGGSWLSWKRREAKNWWIKLILALMMLVALANFMFEIGQNPFDARVPLAHLLIWLQVLHSFDLPRRKDLFYSLWVALVLISVAATLSREANFSIFLIAYGFFSLLSIFFSHLSSQKVTAPPLRVSARILLPVMGLTVIGALLTFLVMPRYEGLKIQSFPVSIQIKNLPFFQGEIKNKAYPNRGDKGNAGGSKDKKNRGKFDPLAYYGFSTDLDLNYRGKLSDQVVMRVQSNRPAYWRGMSFDLYDGQSWHMAEPDKLRRLGSSQAPIWVRQSSELKQNIVPRERLVQTYYIEKDQSNLVFHASYAELVYFPTTYLLMDRYNGLRSPIELFEGTVYTVISEVPIFDTKKLKNLTWNQVLAPVPAQQQAREYLDLPTTIPARVKTLAQSWTQDSAGPYEALRTLEQKLRQNYPYNLEIPEFPENVDTVDYFLFEQKAGYCEHFASSFVVMARMLGLPARFVTGYTAGQFNPITGYFEVRSSDAHGWAEVYFPNQGWVPFDPTPGYLAYLSEPSVNKQNNLNLLAKFLAQWLPAGLKKGIENALNASIQVLANGYKAVLNFLTVVSPARLSFWVGCLIALILAGVFIRSRSKKAASNEPPWSPAYAQEAIRLGLSEHYLAWLQAAEQNWGINTALGATPRERVAVLLNQADTESLQQALNSLTDHYYRLRYDPQKLEPELPQACEQLLKELQQKLEQLQRTPVN